MVQLRIEFDNGPKPGSSGRLLRPCEDAPSFSALPRVPLLGSIASGLYSNLSAILAPRPRLPFEWRYAPMFRSACLERKPRGQSLFTSALLHTAVIACLITLPSLPGGKPPRPADEPNMERTVLYYTPTAPAHLLPEISPPLPKRAASHATSKRKPEPQRKLPDFAIAIPPRAPEQAPVQTIISKPPKADNQRQTIIQPQAPELPKTARIELPNLVYWQGVAMPPQPVASEATRELAKIALPKLPVPNVAPPKLPQPPPEPPKLAEPKRNISELAMNAMTHVEMPKLPVPPAPPLPAPPNVPEPRRNLSELATTALSPPAPKPPAPVRKRAELPPAPPASSTGAGVNVAGQEDALRNLIAVSAAPAPPDEKVKLPEGNRAGEFAVSPNAGEKASQEVPGGKSGAARIGPDELAGRELAEIRVPNLSVTGGRAIEPAGPAAEVPNNKPTDRSPEARRSPLAPPDEALRKLIASTARPSLLPTPDVSRESRESARENSRDREIEAGFFGRKRVYTLAINMPNLTSGSGSWVLHFAELNSLQSSDINAGEELSSPVALKKVDPRYDPSAVRERVEGIVLLAARILRDGKVSEVHVLQGLDPRLDASAAAALAGWQFSPATKRGAPVDLEVVVQIPFRLPTF